MVQVAAAADPTPASNPKRVLVLHSFGPAFLPWSDYSRSIKSELELKSPWPLDIQEHTLLTARFNNPGPEAPFVDYLASLYHGALPDIVLSIGAPAAQFVQKYRERLFPSTPTVLTVVEQRLVNQAELTDNDIVVAVRNDFLAVFEDILHVLPDTRSVAVVVGASPLEKFWMDELRRELRPLNGRIALESLSELSFEDILKRASNLPPHTVLFWGMLSVDAAGINHEADSALQRLSAVANVPIFSFQQSFFGNGVVGGRMHLISETTSRTSDAVLRVLNGEKPNLIRYQPIVLSQPRYDDRQLKRWGISESILPAGSEIVNREPLVWERYRWQVMLILSVILVQAGLISGLLHERRRRQVAEVESRQRLAELAHVNRYSAVGELTTSIAHELNQPLGSILTNAETAELMLDSASPDLGEIKEILADIRRDDQRASEVIRRLRSILKKTPFEVSEIELNATVRDATELMQAVAHARRISLSYLPSVAELRIKGDAVQLQQVVVNLIINALDAVSEAETSKREVAVSTRLSGRNAVIRVTDTGPGIGTAELGKVFDPFFTTKIQGMGMGLAIAKTIVEAHDGTITAENQAFGGAAFTIRLPVL